MCLVSIKAVLLFPFAFIWEWVYIFRRFLFKYGFFKQSSFRVPIISVGNLTFGGAGKTPFTIWLGKYIQEKNLKTTILTRGYRGQFEGDNGLIQAGNSFKYNPADYGDEALLIARRLPEVSIIVGKRRSANLSFYFDKVSPDVVLLDDGYQHLKLPRNFNFALFDARLDIEKYKVAPLGYLREGLTALQDADAVVLSRVDQVAPDKVEQIKSKLSPYLPPKVVWATIKYVPTGVFTGSGELKYSISDLKGMKAVAAAAVASPGSFFDLLESLGLELVEKKVFPDHHYFSSEDIDQLIAKAKEENATIIVSEKDIVKIMRSIADEYIFYLGINVVFTSGESAVKSKLDRILSLSGVSY